MPKINNDQLSGRIKELHAKHNLEFYTTDDLGTALKWVEQIRTNVKNSIAVDIETSGFYFYRHDVLGIGIAMSLFRSVYFNIRDWITSDIKTLLQAIKNLPQKKIYHNMFFDVRFLLGRYGVFIDGDYDTLTYAHALYSDRQYYDEGLGLKDLTIAFLPFGDYEEELNNFKKNYCKINKIKQEDFSFSFIPDDILAPYCCMDVICTLHLFNIFEQQVRNFENSTWTKIRDVINIKHEANKLYIKASVKGIKVNKDKVLEIHNELQSKQIEVLEKIKSNIDIKKAERIVKRRALTKMQDARKTKAPFSRCKKEWNKIENQFNVSSNAHKSILFFEILGLKPISKTKTGESSVDVKTVTHYAKKGVEIMSLIDEYNKIDKILNSFLGVGKTKGLWGLMSDDERIHSNFNINGTISSRLSTSDVNLAQYPGKGMAKLVKKCIEVEEGYKFMSFDFKSFEVAILAFIANEPNIKNMLYDNYDLHSFTAYNVFKDQMELESVEMKDIMAEIKEKYDKTFRFKSKSINFLIPYDGSATGLSKSINSTKKEAQEMLDNYMNTNSKIKEFMKNNKLEAHSKGYIENYYGARLYLRNVKRYNPFKNNLVKNWKAIEEYRVTTNFKIQSFNSFYLYTRLVPFFKEIENLRLDIELMFTVYDSLMLRVNEKIPDKVVLDLLIRHFETVMDDTPFGIDVSRTPDGKRDWYSYDEFDIYSTNSKNIIDKARKM